MAIFLQRPFPPYANSRRSGLAAFIAAIIVFSILFFLEPFNLHQETNERKFALSLAFGAATLFVSTVFLVLLPLFLPAVFDSRRWTVGKEILFFCLLLTAISIANALVNTFTQQIPFSIGMLIRMTGNTLLVGIVPVSVSVFVKQQVLLRHFQRGANAINAVVTGRGPIPILNQPEPFIEGPGALIRVSGDNQGELLTLLPGEWMAAEANDNYVRIYFEKTTGPDSVLFRTTLKKLEGQLKGHFGLYRCHKSFLVNLQKVSHLSGNAQGYRLHLKGSNLQIPVSRSLNAELKEKLKASNK